MKPRQIKQALGTNNAATAAESAIDASQLQQDAAEQLAIEQALKTSAASRIGQTFTLSLSIEQAHAMSREHGGVPSRLQAQDSGSNSALDEFLHVMLTIANSTLSRSFTVHDVISQSRRLDLPSDLLVDLFNKYTAYMVSSLQRLKCVHGCYSEPVYTFEV